MPYPAILFFHLIAVAIFGSGVFVAAAMLPGLQRSVPLSPAKAAALRRIRLWNLAVTTPALLLVWIAGWTMASEAGWFAAGWLQIKMALVLVLSAIHGLQSSWLRRIQRGDPAPSRPAIWLPWAVVVLLSAIVLLVGLKPF